MKITSIFYKHVPAADAMVLRKITYRERLEVARKHIINNCVDMLFSWKKEDVPRTVTVKEHGVYHTFWINEKFICHLHYNGRVHAQYDKTLLASFFMRHDVIFALRVCKAFRKAWLVQRSIEGQQRARMKRNFTIEDMHELLD